MKFTNFKSKKYFENQLEVTKISFSAEWPNLVISLVSAVLASSVVVWTDTILSLSFTLQPLLILLVLKGLINDHQEDKYNYGTLRVENLSAFACNALVIFGLSITSVMSVLDIVKPVQPSKEILVFIVIKVINCTVDTILLLRQIKLLNQSEGALATTEWALFKQNMTTDVVMLLTGIICFVFREKHWAWYVSPVISIAVSIFYIVINVRSAKQIISELSDVSIPVKDQERIFDIIVKNASPLSKIHSVNAHELGQTIHVDVDVAFRNNITCDEELAWLNMIASKIKANINHSYEIQLVHKAKENIRGAIKFMKNNILFKKILRSSYVTCVIYGLVMPLTFSVDSAIAGIFMDTNSVAAVGIGIPFIGFMISLLTLVAQGSYIKIISCIGNSDHAGVNRVYSIGFSLVTLIGTVFLALCVFQSKTLADLGGASMADPEAARQAALYIMSASAMIPFFSIGLFMQNILASFGYHKIRMWCSVLNIVSNIAVSCTAVFLLPDEYKILGLGFGSAVACFLQFLFAIIYKRKYCSNVSLRFFRPKKADIISVLDIVRKGMPMSSDTIIESAIESVVNNIILATFVDNGTELIAIYTIIVTFIQQIAFAVGSGTLYIGEPLFGYLYQKRDVYGLRAAVRDVFLYGLTASGLFAAVIIALQNPLLALFQMSGNENLRMGIIMTALSTPLLTIEMLLSGFYENTEHLTLSAAVCVIPDSVLFPLMILILGKAIGPVAIWISFAFNMVVFIVLFYIVLMIVHRTVFVSLNQLLFLKPSFLRNVPGFDLSVMNGSDDIGVLSEAIRNSCTEYDCDQYAAEAAALCVESIIDDYKNYRTQNNKNDFPMDIKLYNEEEQVKFIFRNFDAPYNPFENLTEGENQKSGLEVVKNKAFKINYNHVCQMNELEILFRKNTQRA